MIRQLTQILWLMCFFLGKSMVALGQGEEVAIEEIERALITIESNKPSNLVRKTAQSWESLKAAEREYYKCLKIIRGVPKQRVLAAWQKLRAPHWKGTTPIGGVGGVAGKSFSLRLVRGIGKVGLYTIGQMIVSEAAHESFLEEFEDEIDDNRKAYIMASVQIYYPGELDKELALLDLDGEEDELLEFPIGEDPETKAMKNAMAKARVEAEDYFDVGLVDDSFWGRLGLGLYGWAH